MLWDWLLLFYCMLSLLKRNTCSIRRIISEIILNSLFLDVADNVTYPYNELLHIAVETGMCGLVLFLLVVSPFVFSDERTLKAALAAWLIFAMFSYPVNVVPLMMDFALFIELRRGKTVSVLDINRILCGIAVVPLMGLLAVCGHVMLFLM